MVAEQLETQELFRKHAEFLQKMLVQQNIAMKSLLEKFGERMNGGEQSGAENPMEGGKGGGGKEGERDEGKDNWAMYKGLQQEGKSSGSAEEQAHEAQGAKAGDMKVRRRKSQSKNTKKTVKTGLMSGKRG